MKSLDAKKGEKKADNAAAAGVQLDLSKVKIEPLFEDAVDFETFSKSDFRVVKVEACEAVPKSKKLLKFTLNDGTDPVSYTHLDVYKRQTLHPAPGAPAAGCADQFGSAAGCGQWGGRGRACLLYTSRCV